MAAHPGTPSVGALATLRTSPAADMVVNGVLFNISWFVIVLTQSPVIAPLQVVAHLLVHFMLLGRGLPELRLILLVAAGGLVLDHLLFALGVFTVSGQAALAPLWFSCLWPVFATTLTHAFAGFRERVMAAVLLGALGGGGSYVAGVRLTDVDFAWSLYSPLLVALLWAVLFPLLLQLGGRLVAAPEGDG